MRRSMALLDKVQLQSCVQIALRGHAITMLNSSCEHVLLSLLCAVMIST